MKKGVSHPPFHIGWESGLFEGNGDVGRYVGVPGSYARAQKIALHFDDYRAISNNRMELTTFVGTYKGIDVAVVSSEMGPGAASIAYEELSHFSDYHHPDEPFAKRLIGSNARRLLRFGSCGAMQPEIKVDEGSVIIATGAVRDEMTSRKIMPVEFPALAHPDAVQAAKRASRALGFENITYAGVVHTKPELYAIEEGLGPMGAENQKSVKVLEAGNVVATSMEEAVLFVTASSFNHHRALSLAEESCDREQVRAGSVLAVFGGYINGEYQPFSAQPEDIELAENNVIKLGLETIVQWAIIDGIKTNSD